MSRRHLLRLFIPALLLAGAALIWAWWPNGAKEAEMPAAVPIVFVALALISALRSFVEDVFDIPLALWAVIGLIVVIGIVLFYSTAIGVLAIMALIVIVAFFFAS